MRSGLLVEGVCPGVNKFIHALAQKSQDSLVGFLNGWEGLYQGKSFLIDKQAVKKFENAGGSVLSSSSLQDIPKNWKYTMMENLLKYGIDLLLVVGNEHSLAFANELFSAGIRIILIPSADFSIGSYRIGLNTVVNKLSECIYYFKEFSKTSKRKIVLCLPSKFSDLVEQMKYVHSFFSKEFSGQILISWDEFFEDYDCIVKIEGILKASKPLEKDIAFAQSLAQVIASRSLPKGGSMLIYKEDFEFLALSNSKGEISR